MRDLYTAFAAHILFPAQERLKGHNTVQIRRELEKTQWWQPADIEALRLARLQKLISAAGKNVPFYRRVFAETNFDPSKITSLQQLQDLPFLTKEIIRKESAALKAEGAQLSKFNTGGSSGEPLIFFIGQRVAHDVAAKWRATRWWGVDIGDPEIVLWGSPVELGAQDRVRAWRDRIFRSKLLPAFEMSENKLDHFIAEIRALKPRMLFGYPSSLALLARHAQKKNIRLNKLGVKVAFVTAERLYDDQKTMIATTFACPVANGYGARDAGFIAHECPQGGMHITAEDILVEIIDRDGAPVLPGTLGEIVITHLATTDFPFIRYRTGDMAALDNSTCPCGRGLTKLKDIQGRTTDFVVAVDGTIMHGLALIYPLRDEPSIQAFKIIQESLAKTRVLIVPQAGWDTHVPVKIQAAFQARLGSDVTVEIEVVDAIPAEASGKFRYVISHVQPT